MTADKTHIWRAPPTNPRVWRAPPTNPRVWRAPPANPRAIPTVSVPDAE